MADVSVIIAVRDGARYLPEALASVAGQSTPAREVIVVDDGSTDGSGRVAARSEPAVRVVTRPPTGYAAAVNHGVSVATSPLLAFLDADDRWDVDALACRLDRLGGDDAPDVVVGSTRNFLSPDLTDAEAAGIRFHERTFHAEVLTAALVRAEVVRRVGMLDETLRTGAAIDWVSRARLAGVTFAHVDHVVLHRRVHAANLGRSQQAARNADLLQIVRAHHARHRPG
jgi:glycosyltransferase involved in cell wall biosynthesis